MVMIMENEMRKHVEGVQAGAAGRGKAYDMAYCAIFAVLIAICSWISIPMAVPFTLQTFAVFLTLSVLFSRRFVCG